MQRQEIGLIGVGLMGSGIAGSLLRAGWPLHFLRHPGNRPTEDIEASGAVPHDSAADLAAAVDVVILCVTGSPQVEDALTRPDGVLAGIRPGSTVIDCSTAVPTSTLRLAARVEEAGCGFLDAPMTRTPKEAAEGRLNLIVGGAEDLFHTHRPLLESFAENIAHAGGTGAGHRMKLLHNFVSLGFSAVLAEATVAAERAGIDTAVFEDVLAKGGGKGAVLDRFGPWFAGQDPSGFRFTLANGAKDMGYFVEMATSDGGAGSVARAVAGLYADNAKAHPDRLIPELVTLLSQD